MSLIWANDRRIIIDPPGILELLCDFCTPTMPLGAAAEGAEYVGYGSLGDSPPPSTASYSNNHRRE